MNKIACDYSDRVSSSFFRKDSLQRNAMLVDLVPSYTFGFAGVLDAMVTSEEAGVEKPNPKIFLDCLHKLQIKPQEALYIGDSFERDIIGAHAAGLLPFWLNTTRQQAPRVDFPYKELHSLTEVL